MMASMLKRPQILVLALVSMVFATLLFAPAQASAATLSEDAEKFIRYRAIHGCLAMKDLEGTSPTRVIQGDWWEEEFGRALHRDMGGALYSGKNPAISCEDSDGDKFIEDSASVLGFSNPGTMWCSIQPGAYRDNEGSGNDFEKCVTGSGDYDGSGSKSAQASQFTEGIKNYSSIGTGFPFDPSGAVRYYIYYETFKKFCDVDREKDYIERTDKTLADSKEYVVVNEVVLENGVPKVVPALYKVNVDDGQDHNIEGVWSLPDGKMYDLNCGELAAKTWEFDDDYGRYIAANPEEAVDRGSGPDGSSNAPVCTAGALGWVICPAINFIATMTDGIYSIVENMLVIDPMTVENGGALYQTWTKFRDIANVLFVIAFFFVIFSQATSVGLSSYGVKKLLPRVIASAILVNISFFICQIGLDISNLVGVSIDDMFASLHSDNSVDINVISWETLIAGILGGGAIWGGAAVILGAGGITAAMAMILPFLVTALFAIVTAIAVLIARQVIIVLLIALAPLAFVAFILPNTQKYFQMWQNTFTTMLVMFPLIAALFAGSQLAANIILSSPTDEDGIGLFTYIAAICMLFIPLFGIPYIVKFSGGILGRVAGVVNNPNKGPFDALRKKAEGYRDTKQDQARMRNANGEYGRGVSGSLRKNTFGRYNRRRADIDAIRQTTKREADEAVSGYIAEKAVKDESFARKMAGGEAYQGSNIGAAVRRVQAQGIAHEREESRKRVTAIQQRLLHDRVEIKTDSAGNVDFSEGMGKVYADAAARGDYETVSAVINEAHKQGSFGRQATANMLTRGTITDESGSVTSEKARAAQFEVTQSVYGLNMPARTDVTKGQMITQEVVANSGGSLSNGDIGKWQLKSVSALATEQKASLDGSVLREAIYANQISQPEATRIVTTNLKDRVENQELINMLEHISTTGSPPPRPGGGGGPTAPPPASSGGGGTTPPTPSGGGSAPSGRVNFNFNNNPPPPSGGPGPTPNSGPGGPTPSGGGGGTPPPAPSSGGPVITAPSDSYSWSDNNDNNS